MRGLLTLLLVLGAMGAAVWRAERFGWVVVAAACSLLAAAAAWWVAERDARYFGAVLVCGGVPLALVMLPVACVVHEKAPDWRPLLAGPREVSIDALDQAPPLPAYVRLRGVVRSDLEIKGSYTSKGSKGSTHSTSYCRLPVVPEGWRPGEVAPVVTTACSYQREPGVVQGWLQRLPGGGSMLRSKQIDDGGKISLTSARFRIDPRRTLFLEATGPVGSLGLGVIFCLFWLAFALLLVGAMSAGFWPEPPSKEASPPDEPPPQGRSPQ